MIRTTVKIDGMMCGMCESHVNDAVRRAIAVKKVSSSHSKGVTVIESEDAIDREKLRVAIEKDGYRVLEITEETVEKKEKKGLFARFFLS
ncbi:MAG: cation transporter [Clostridia bacterium]|nr:cation transporter [Clostridia bacterium]